MQLRAWIYDRAVRPMTASWYRAVLERLAPGTRLLDIGIGTGGALVANAALVRERDLRVTGVDIDPDYVRRCREHVARHGLADRVEVLLESVYDHGRGDYDAAYFSGSFMLMPEPAGVLRHVAGLLREGGRVYFTQTFQERRAPVLERAKPLLRKLTTVDFGRVTYEVDFLRALAEAGVEVDDMLVLERGRARTSRLITATLPPREPAAPA